MDSEVRQNMDEEDILEDFSAPAENDTTTTAGTEVQGKANNGHGEWKKEDTAETTRRPEGDDLSVDVDASKKLKPIITEDFGRLTPGDFLAVVKAYVTRTFAEDIELLGKLTNNTGTIDCLYDQLKTSLEGGTDDSEELKQARENVFGRNATEQRSPTPFWYLLWNASKDFILRILIVAALISLTLGIVFGQNESGSNFEWIEGAAILLAVVIVLLVTAGNDWLKERQFAALIETEQKFCSCRRSSQLRELPVESLLVGDVILVEAGDEIPADCLTLSCHDLALDESSMTGESDPVKKSPYEEGLAQSTELWEKQSSAPAYKKHHLVHSPVVLSGSTVTNGSAILLVIAVGENSEAGQLLQKLNIDTEPTPLQNKLNALALCIGNFGFAAACVTLVVLIIQYWIFFAVYPEKRTDERASQVVYSHIQFLVEAVTIIVVAVPEGLPLAVTLSFAFSVRLMLKDQNYVRRLAACETMGSANEICSDKTGTLTKNQMTVQEFWNGSKLSKIDGRTLPALVETEPTFTTEESKDALSELPTLPKRYLDILMELIAVNSTAFLEEQTVKANVGAGTAVTVIKHVGSPTECALLQFLVDMGYDYSKIRSEKGSESQLVHRIPFNSTRKIMTTVVKCPDAAKPECYRVYVKGAAEVVLRLCHTRIDSTGHLRNVESIHIDRFERQIIGQLTSHALRAICLAYKDFDPTQQTDWDQLATLSDLTPSFSHTAAQPLLGRVTSGGVAPSTGLTNMVKDKKLFKMELGLNCLGIVGISDPVRNEVPAAVRRCQGAGIRVRMVTGDNIETAKQIGIKCNIYHPETGGLALTGAEFYSMIGGIVCDQCRTEQCDCVKVSGSKPPTAKRGIKAPAASSDVSDSKSLHQTPTSNTQMLGVSDPGQGVNAIDAQEAPSTSNGNEQLMQKHAKTPGTSAIDCGCTPCRSTVVPAVEDPKQGEANLRLRKKTRVDVVGDLDSFKKIASNLEILARSQPSDKYALVVGLKSIGSIVAVTGDGTNDAPALKRADVGFAMGIAGKEVAKQAADIVLLDDNFESIVKAVKWGRNIYDNIKRFLQFQLTVNVVAVVTAFIGAVVLRESPLHAVQLLWVNLVMDTFASLALATEPPTEQQLDRPPHSKDEYLVNRLMTRNILGQACYQLTVMMVLIFTGERWIPERSSPHYAEQGKKYEGFSEFSPYGGGQSFVTSGRRFKPFSTDEEYKHTWAVNIGPSRHFTLVFNSFVWLQIFNMINARKINNELNVFGKAFSNPLWLIIMSVISVGQILLTQFGGYALQCHLDGLTGAQWAICVALGLGSLLVQLIIHWIPAEKLKYIPQAGKKEEDLLAAPTSLALASRGRISTDRLFSRLTPGSLGSQQWRRPTSATSLSVLPSRPKKMSSLTVPNLQSGFRKSQSGE